MISQTSEDLDVAIDEIVHFINLVCVTLVDTPKDIRVRVEKNTSKICFIVSPNRREVGQLVGEKGCIANSLRILIKAVSNKLQMPNVFLAVISPDEFEK